jgi:hypothetical protein
VNRRERRSKKTRGEVEKPKVYLDLHCAGPHSEPPVACDRRLIITIPFDVEDLRRQAWENDFFTTVTSPPGLGFVALTVLCGSCARKILPAEMIEVAVRTMTSRGSA